VINGEICVAGGFDSTRAPTKTLFVYSAPTNSWTRKADLPAAACPATNTWHTKAEMPTAHTAVGGRALGGKLYVIGGSTALGGSSAVATVNVDDPRTNKWMTKASMPTARRALAAEATDGFLLAVGGELGDGTTLATTEAYTP
jgi:N-acetylneuraminic acid mutarotase